MCSSLRCKCYLTVSWQLVQRCCWDPRISSDPIVQKTPCLQFIQWTAPEVNE
jgi:hypothetical protein